MKLKKIMCLQSLLLTFTFTQMLGWGGEGCTSGDLADLGEQGIVTGDGLSGLLELSLYF